MAPVPEYSLIRQDRRDGVLIWTLDREARLNALPDLTDEDMEKLKAFLVEMSLI